MWLFQGSGVAAPRNFGLFDNPFVFPFAGMVQGFDGRLGRQELAWFKPGHHLSLLALKFNKPTDGRANPRMLCGRILPWVRSAIRGLIPSTGLLPKMPRF